MKAAKKNNLDRRTTIFLEIIGELFKYDNAGLEQLAESASIHWVTLYNWKSGKTSLPRLDTITRVAVAMGYELRLVRVRKQRAQLTVVK